ncbi:MAG TPA: hypothetical protein VGR37_14760 [Longimicrobiaceae bacterium]|nr:hypothetical protein [Longimicrobiaceae bacterium]
MPPTCPLCRNPMIAAEDESAGLDGGAPRHVCRSPGCISNAFASNGATWIGAGSGPQAPAPEVIGNSRSEPALGGSTSWLGVPSEPPRLERTPRPSSGVRERPSSGHDFEDGVCLNCGRLETLAGRYGWSCPVRLP